MNARFYAPGNHAPGITFDLSEEEAQHATRVLRLGVGAAIRIFDGRGQEFDAGIVEVGKHTVRVEVGRLRSATPETGVALMLVQAVLKGDKMDDVIRDAVMLGVSAIQPIVTERTAISLAALNRGDRRERWERIAVSSTKQCGRAVVPAIRTPVPFGRPVFSAAEDTLSVMCVEPGLAAGGNPVSSLPTRPPRAAQVLVGPEGGWTPEEVARGVTSASLLTLGGRTLRADAMALIALTAILTHWREM
jgi:16S rRNA (uracil1498-N3)-methyltransferase